MRKHLKNSVLICLLAVLVLILASCGSKSIVFASPEMPFGGNILFDSETENSAIARDAAVEFKDMLAEHSLGNIRTVMSSSLINELEGEILFGSSDREASIKAEELLLSNNAYKNDDFYWSYCYLDGKLAIVANHEIAYTLAVRGFFESYFVDGSIVIPDDLLVCDTLSYSDYLAMFNLPKGESVPETEEVEIDLTLGEGYDMGQGSKLYIQNDSDIFAYTELRQSLEAAGFKYYTGNRIGDIGAAVENFVISNGFSIVKTYTGHGIGAELHEDPSVPNYGRPGRGTRLYSGMTLAVEPMVNLGKEDVRVLKDGWTVITADGSLSAHYENSIAITESDPILLTDVDN